MKSKLKKRAHAKRLELQKTYGIKDAGGRDILDIYESALLTSLECEETIARDGLKVEDRFGQLRCHPLLPVLRDARSQILASLRALNLDIEPLRDGPGRPGLYENDEED